MKIAHLISTYLPAIGGAQICIHNVAQRHVQQGHQVVVVTPHEFAAATGAYEKKPLARGTLFFLKYCFPFGQGYLLNQVKQLQRQYQFDLWQVTIGYPFGVALVDYFKENKIPCVLRCSGEDIQINPALNYGIRLNHSADYLIRQNYPKFDACVAISGAMAKEYRDLKVGPEKIREIPNGVDWSRFDSIRNDAAAQARRERIRTQYKVNKEDILILTVGRNHPKKGFSSIPEIAAELLKHRQDFKWLVIGEGSQNLKPLAEKAGKEVSDRLIFSETVGLKNEGNQYPSRELIEVLDAGDLFAFPTIIETFGIVVIEAMAAGLPIVTTNAPGVAELVDHEITGLKSPVGNAKAMAANIDVLLNQDLYYKRIKANVLQETEKYDWDHVSDLYLNLYQELVDV
jgi:glycosyltransferase involved in cell wall biosynthesis